MGPAGAAPASVRGLFAVISVFGRLRIAIPSVILSIFKGIQAMKHSIRRVSPIPLWPTYRGVSHYLGASPTTQVSVYVDPSLGAAAFQNGTDLVNDADRVVKTNNALFATPSQPVNVIIFALGGKTDGTGGADHNSCDYTKGGDIEVCASFGNSSRVSALFEAEISECSMGGNLCGVSSGEALSRWCALVVSNNALADFATAPAWMQRGMPDFVNKTDGTDQNEISTGCGMAFLSWLQQLGHALNVIAPAMVALGSSATLAQLYAKLTSGTASDAWPKFLAAVKLLPQITNDDPFGKSSIAGREVMSAVHLHRTRNASKARGDKKSVRIRKR